MNNARIYDICVIGAGSAGLSVASGAAQFGLDTVLIEAGEMGGDCLNTGCVPSKALLAAGKQAHIHRHPFIPAIPPHESPLDRAGINAHVRQTIETIAPHDSVERFEKLGVTVVREHATFLDGHRVRAGNAVIAAKKFIVAAGSRPAIPAIEGLDPARILTNETVFDLPVLPEHLIVIGGGPIGVELAQAHRRLGCRVTLLQRHTILPRDEPEAVEVVRAALRGEGVEIAENASVRSVRHGRDGHVVTVGGPMGDREIAGSHILLATGRRANVEGLSLEAAGVEHDENGIRTDARLRTTNKDIFAIGDIAGGPRFTHVAGYHAGIVLRNLAFRLPAKVDYRTLPWVTFCDPELAHVGLTLSAAQERHGAGVRSLVMPFTGVDRAVAERRTEGLLKLVAAKNGRILGCSIAAPSAGELIALWALAIQRKLKLRDLAGLVLPYPTYGEITKQAAGEWYRPSLFGDRTRRIVQLLQKLPSF